MVITTNVHLQYLIGELKKEAVKNDAGIWKRIACDLEKPTTRRRVVNISRLNRFTQNNDVVVVAGKVLGTGEMNHPITIAAWDFSAQAKTLIENETIYSNNEPGAVFYRFES